MFATAAGMGVMQEEGARTRRGGEVSPKEALGRIGVGAGPPERGVGRGASGVWWLWQTVVVVGSSRGHGSMEGVGPMCTLEWEMGEAMRANTARETDKLAWPCQGAS